MQIFCDVLIVAVFLITPFKSCDELGRPSKYKVDYMDWCLVYLLLSVLKNLKYYIDQFFVKLHNRDRISYRTRSHLILAVTFIFEVGHLCWQIYGNFIYYEWRGKSNESNEEFETCMDLKNNGLEMCMLIFLMVGYCYFFIYIYVICVVIFMMTQRNRSRANRMTNANLALNSI
jgi:cbb3-type cytochrome oxidase subunit 3